MSPGMFSPAWETSCDLCIGIHSRLSPLFKLAGIKSVFENQSLLLQTWKGIVELNSARKGVVLWLVRPFMCVRPDYNNLKLLLNCHQMEYGTKLALKRCCWAVCSFFNGLQVAPVETISLVRSPGKSAIKATASECMEIITTDGLKPSKMTEYSGLHWSWLYNQHHVLDYCHL